MYCLCLPAEVALVENPRNFWGYFYGPRGVQVVQPYFFGDDRQKTTYLYTRGTDARIPWTDYLGRGDSTWHGQHLATVEETNKFRCRLLPGMAAAVAAHAEIAVRERSGVVLHETSVGHCCVGRVGRDERAW